MNFDFDDTEQRFQAAVRRYIQERLRPMSARWDRGERLTRDVIRELGELGVLGIRVPLALGGSEASYMLAGIAAEELARGDLSITLLLQWSVLPMLWR